MRRLSYRASRRRTATRHPTARSTAELASLDDEDMMLKRFIVSGYLQLPPSDGPHHEIFDAIMACGLQEAKGRVHATRMGFASWTATRRATT